MNIIRNYLLNNRFCEIEILFLIVLILEGVRDYLVLSRVNLGKFYVLL